MTETPRLYEQPRARDQVLPAWERDRQVLMTEDEWRALPEERRTTILRMYERLQRRKDLL